MTTHTHRTPFRPFDRDARRQRLAARAAQGEHGDHLAGVELLLAALLVLVAGPVARTFAPPSNWLAASSATMLLVGITLAAAAAWHLLHARR